MHKISLHLEDADAERLPLGETPPEQPDGERGQLSSSVASSTWVDRRFSHRGMNRSWR
jgi:hypothetical protein